MIRDVIYANPACGIRLYWSVKGTSVEHKALYRKDEDIIVSRRTRSTSPQVEHVLERKRSPATPRTST